MSDSLRVYVNATPVDVPRGATAIDAIRSVDPALAAGVMNGTRSIADSRGLFAPPNAPLHGGAILRVIGSRTTPVAAGAAAGANATGRADDEEAGPGSGTPATRDLLRRLPKTELHCHLDGSLRPATMVELAAECGFAMPEADAVSLGRYMRVDDARHLEDYLRRFDITLGVMQTGAALERIAYELAEDAASETVRYIEVRFAPVLNIVEGLTTADAVEAVLRGLARAESDHGIVGRVIICSLRHLSPIVSMDLAHLAVAYRHRGVVAFDLAGAERGNPAGAHAAAFEYARSHDLACTVHAGEGDGPASIRAAIHQCGADRIGHATRLIEDESLMEYANDRRIGLEICLTSNVQTRAVDSYEMHPLRRYFDRGLNVSLSTDNRLMSGTSLTDEYEHAMLSQRFTLAEVGALALNGFESAFLPRADRLVLLDSARKEIARLVEAAT